jgi:hypothetical protein
VNLKRPDERTLAALKRLRGDTDSIEVMAWLQTALAELDERNRTLTDPVLLHQGQGAAQVLSAILQYGQYGKVPAIATKSEVRTG